ncbi:MAG: RrF2 family transcriptional regulator [Pirellulales bacterium]
MRLSAKTEYAALAALELARRHGPGEPVRIRAICEAEGVPARFLVQILLQLKAAGIVTSVRGASGGYRLALPPDEITLDDVRRAVEGQGEGVAPVSVALAGRSRAAAALAAAWGDAADAEADSLRRVTLADLAARCRPAAEAMYYI